MIWREPAEESDDLYPGLTVNDGRVSGSILVGHTRLPLWAFVSYAVTSGWGQADSSYDIQKAGLTSDQFGEFLWALLEQRGEFGRLLLILADVERRDSIGDELGDPWWRDDIQKARVVDQLQRCIDALRGSHD